MTNSLSSIISDPERPIRKGKRGFHGKKGMLSYSEEEISAVLRQQRGLIALAARKLGQTRGSVYARIKKSPVLQEVVREAREEMLDEVESKLFERVEAGEMAAICFVLKCQGKARGWIERPESEIHLNQQLQLNAAKVAADSGLSTPAKTRAFGLAKHFNMLAQAAAVDHARTLLP